MIPIECVEHGAMNFDDARKRWFCSHCERTITDEELYRLMTNPKATAIIVE